MQKIIIVLVAGGPDDAQALMTCALRHMHVALLYCASCEQYREQNGDIAKACPRSSEQCSLVFLTPELPVETYHHQSNRTSKVGLQQDSIIGESRSCNALPCLTLCDLAAQTTEELRRRIACMFATRCPPTPSPSLSKNDGQSTVCPL